MKIQLNSLIVLLLIFGSMLSACAPEQTPAPAPTSTPAAVSTPVPTQTPAPLPTVTAAIDPTAAAAIQMDCTDQANLANSVFRAENNTWGKGDLTGWSQCIGLETGTDGTLSARWTWDWLNSGGNVKAYPEIVFGQKPGSQTSSPDLPEKIDLLQDVTITYDIASTHTGSGNIAFDIWLTNTQNPDTWGAPPITHEIMIWLDAYGSMAPGGNWTEKVEIDGSIYQVYFGADFGGGWDYIAFSKVDPRLGKGSINLVSFLKYMKSKGYVTGEEYVASIEFGNEVTSGSGETLLRGYAISVKK